MTPAESARPALRVPALERARVAWGRAGSEPDAPPLMTIQLGEGWLPEESGGLNRYYHDLVHRLPSVGIEVAGMVTGSGTIERDTKGVIRAFAGRGDALLRRLGGARREVGRLLVRHPDALTVAHFALYAAPCLGQIAPERLVVHFHGPWADESREEGGSWLATTIKRRVERAVYRRASRLIVLSRAFRDLLTERYGVDPSRIRVIPGGVDTGRFALPMTKVEARRSLGWPAGRPTVLVVRRLVRRMGLEGLIAAIRRARALVPDLLVVIAGTGPLAGELARRTAANGLDDQIRFPGFLSDEDLPAAYRAADLTVVPSVAWEGFGLVVAESLAAGTPALVTAVGGLPATLDGLAPQCVVRERTPKALAAALADALRGRLELPNAAACAAHARARFDWSVVAQRIGAVYREVGP